MATIFTPDGRKIKPAVGFAAGWHKVDAGGSADAIASQHTYQDWEPLESMETNHENSDRI